MQPPVPVERWQSRSTFVLALALAAVGLGNVWRFGWLLGENGGGPFFLSYVACLLLVAVPLLVAEVLLGSHGRGSPFLTMGWATETSGRSRIWLLAALLGCLAAFLALAAVLLLAGWSLAYLFHLQLGEFSAMGLDDTAEFLATRLENPVELLEWQLLLSIVVGLISVAGIRRGLGLFAWVAVPAVMALGGLLIDYAIRYGDLPSAGDYLFAWQTMDFDGGSFMNALVHAGFTLIAGVAVGLSYGAHAPDRIPIVRSVLAVALFDLVMAVTVALVVFPLLFEANVLPSEGFSLLFVAVPFAYGNMPFGDFFGALFFLLVVLTLIGSAVALMEPLLGILEQQLGVQRRRAVLAVIFPAWLVSSIALMDLDGGSGASVLQQIDSTVTDFLVPAALLLFALFVGWRMPRELLRAELSREPDILFSLWYFLIRFLVPPVIAMAWLWARLVS